MIYSNKVFLNEITWIVFLFLGLFPSIVNSQIDSLQQEINDQVWRPFISAFGDRDNETFSKVHSKDFIRVIRDDKRIYGYNVAFGNDAGTQQNQSPWKRSIELRFIERIASEREAFEIGYYQTTYEHRTSGEKSVSYGKFHVLLRKESGVWKILMDADGHEGTNERIFKSASPLD